MSHAGVCKCHVQLNEKMPNLVNTLTKSINKLNRESVQLNDNLAQIYERILKLEIPFEDVSSDDEDKHITVQS